MNGEIIGRLLEAGTYQKMALQALLPEHTRGHVEVIERELKAMLKECAYDIVKSGMYENKERREDACDAKEPYGNKKAADKGTDAGNRKTGGAKKIIIE